MTTHALLRSVLGMLGIAGLSLAPRPAAAQSCEPVGHYQLGYSWHKGTCQALPGDALMEFDIQRNPDGKYVLAPDPEVTPLSFEVRLGVKGCRILIEQRVNQTAYGTPDYALWSVMLNVEGDVVKGTGTYTHVEGTQKPRECQASMTFTGTRGTAPPKQVIEVKAEPKRSPEEIAAMLGKEIEPRRPEMASCWRAAHPDGKGGKGWFRLHIAVRRDGTVRVADIVEDKLNDPQVGLCVIGQAEKWTFTPPGADEVDYATAVMFPPPSPKKDEPPPSARRDGGVAPIPPPPPPAK